MSLNAGIGSETAYEVESEAVGLIRQSAVLMLLRNVKLCSAYLSAKYFGFSTIKSARQAVAQAGPIKDRSGLIRRGVGFHASARQVVRRAKARRDVYLPETKTGALIPRHLPVVMAPIADVLTRRVEHACACRWAWAACRDGFARSGMVGTAVDDGVSLTCKCAHCRGLIGNADAK